MSSSATARRQAEREARRLGGIEVAYPVAPLNVPQWERHRPLESTGVVLVVVALLGLLARPVLTLLLLPRDPATWSQDSLGVPGT